MIESLRNNGGKANDVGVMAMERNKDKAYISQIVLQKVKWILMYL
jgi:hypothetical protein